MKSMDDKQLKNNNIIIPNYLIFFQSFFMYIFLTLFIIFFPLLLVIILNSLIKLNPSIFTSLFIITFFYMIIIGILFQPTYKTLPKKLHKFQNNLVRNWILRNVNCPVCNGKINYEEKKYLDPISFEDYIYKCRNCNMKFILTRINTNNYNLTPYNK